MTSDFIYLASASPRRRELLASIGVPFEPRPADVDERALPGETPAGHVRRLAEVKANAVWEALSQDEARPVLGADTVVVLDGRMLGKPASREEALDMLAALSARTHRVLTGIAVRFGAHAASAVCESGVTFRAMTDGERRAYCDTAEPFDKAGAYGIQGYGAVFIEHLSGSHSAVMGLPLLETAALLRPFGLPRWLAGGETAA